MLGQEFQRRRRSVRHGRHHGMAGAGGHVRHPDGVRRSLPSRTAGAEQRVGPRADLERQHTGILPVVQPFTGGGQGHAQVAPRQPQLRIRAAMGHGDTHVVVAAREGDVDRPVAGLGQLRLPRLEGHRRDQQRVGMRVVHLHVQPLAGHDGLHRQRELQARLDGAHADRDRVDGVRCLVEDERAVPLVGLRRGLEQGLRAERRRWRARLIALGRREVGGSAELDRLRLGRKPQRQSRGGTHPGQQTTEARPDHARTPCIHDSVPSLCLKALS